MPGYTTERSSEWERRDEATPTTRVDGAGGATDVRLQREEANGGDAEVTEILGDILGGSVGTSSYVRGEEKTYA